MTLTAATLPVIRSMLDMAARKGFSGGVLGVKARPQWDEQKDFQHDGVPVRVFTCQSALAVREALLERAPDRWLVVITDRDDAELGLGITARLLGQRLRPPDAWAAVRSRFGASRLDHRLVTLARATEVAHGLLAAAPPEGWPPARAGLLTIDHAFRAVASERLRLGGSDELELLGVLRWTARADAATAVADLRAIAGDALVDAVVEWAADRCGVSGQAVRPLLREGRVGDVVPLGLVARAVAASDPGSGPRALLGREVGDEMSHHVLAVWTAESEAVAGELVATDRDATARVLARGESLLDRVTATSYAGESTVLPSGLTSRLAALGEALRRCADRAPVRAEVDGPDAPLVDVAVLGEVEQRRVQVEAHLLVRDESRVERALAGVRLARWLSQSVSDESRPGTTDGRLGGLGARYRDQDGWADRAVTRAWTGVGDEALAQGLRAVLDAARLRRDTHDLAFGQALAAHHERGDPAPEGLIHLEDLLATTVLPLAKQCPVLLLVADGLSHAVAAEVVDDIVSRYETWLECLPAGMDRRIAAIGALPTVTKVCRASLFSGELTVGEQGAERAGWDALTKRNGVSAHLFHKLSLDSSPGGHALAPGVAAAIDDIAGAAVVACVLNTIDDALDRSDPGGTSWSTETIKHLHPLLERARRAGRIVVLTSDHGHVVERREGRGRRFGGVSSNRSRPFRPQDPAGKGEVRVRGRRVLLHDHDAVLAVDERLHYGPLKAGYHGGVAPAEVLAPVCVLAPGEAPPGWRLAPPQSPAWWRGPQATPGTTPAKQPARHQLATATGPGPTRFDTAESETPEKGGPAGIVAAVLASETYRQQRSRAARATVSDEQVSSLLTALLDAPGRRLDPDSAAAALGIATVQLGGALSQLQRLFNVEQYNVLGRDPDGTTVVLDADLLVEQFGVVA